MLAAAAGVTVIVVFWHAILTMVAAAVVGRFAWLVMVGRSSRPRRHTAGGLWRGLLELAETGLLAVIAANTRPPKGVVIRREVVPVYEQRGRPPGPKRPKPVPGDLPEGY